MGLYKIEFKQSAERDIRKITPTLIPNILRKIEALAGNPFPQQSLKLSGVKVTYRLRVDDYRVIYEVNHEAKTIIIHYVRHRREVYRKL
jgi:mRNA interferase RelE/StbE